MKNKFIGYINTLIDAYKKYCQVQYYKNKFKATRENITKQYNDSLRKLDEERKINKSTIKLTEKDYIDGYSFADKCTVNVGKLIMKIIPKSFVKWCYEKRDF